MTIDTDIINIHAMCRECAKEFMAISDMAKMHRAIQKHLKEHSGHVVIGIEQTRVIYKEKVAGCTAH